METQKQYSSYLYAGLAILLVISTVLIVNYESEKNEKIEVLTSKIDFQEMRIESLQFNAKTCEDDNIRLRQENLMLINRNRDLYKDTIDVRSDVHTIQLERNFWRCFNAVMFLIGISRG